jgi:hypothetical protein
VSDLLTVRYPTGAKEFRMSDKAPRVGDVLKRNGDNWIVEEIVETEEGSQVTLRPGVKLPVEETDGDASNPDDRIEPLETRASVLRGV